MKNIHIIPNEKFTEGFIGRINSEFGKESNFFLVVSNKSYHELKISDNVKMIDRSWGNALKIFKTVLEYDKIFLHNISYINPLLMLLLSLVPKKLKKQYWVMWGMDLYCYEKKKEHWKEKVREWLRRRFIKNLYGIIFWVKGDYELACKWYKTKAKYFAGGYSRKNDLWMSLKDKENCFNDGFVRVQVGNSASPRNNHIEALRKLNQAETEKMLVYCPLSYAGTQEYVAQVIKEGKSLFGDRFIPITAMMDKEKYTEHLSNIDIGIFNADRQMGLGNISQMIALGKKVYINDYTTSWDYCCDRGMVIFAFNKVDFTNECCKNDFFALLNKEQKEKNYETIIENSTLFTKYWKDIFAS